MATFEFTLDETSVGQTIGPPDGFLVNVTRTASPILGVPDHDAARQVHKSNYFCLRGSADVKNLINVETSNPSPSGGFVLGNGNLGYRGSLMILAVPKASTWKLTISDIPYVPPPPQWPPRYSREAEEYLTTLRAKIVSEHERTLSEPHEVKVSARKARRLIEAARQSA